MMSTVLLTDISPLAIGLIISIPFLFIIFALFQILKNQTGAKRLLWIVVVLCFPFFGAVIYFISKYLDREKRKTIQRTEPVDKLR